MTNITNPGVYNGVRVFLYADIKVDSGGIDIYRYKEPYTGTVNIYIHWMEADGCD